MARPVRAAAREAMQKFCYDPLDVLVKFAQEASTPKDEQKEIAIILLPYMYPKLSNVTLEGEVVMNQSAEQQASLLRKVLENPELADAAQRLSIAAAEAHLESSDYEGMIQ